MNIIISVNVIALLEFQEPNSPVMKHICQYVFRTRAPYSWSTICYLGLVTKVVILCYSK